MNNIIAESKLIKEQLCKNTVFKKYLYIDCSCGHYGDAIRVLVSKEISDGSNFNEVLFEFNIRTFYENCCETNGLKRFFKRFLLALRVLIGSKVYIIPDVIMDFEGASNMVSRIEEAIKEVSNATKENQ